MEKENYSQNLIDGLSMRGNVELTQSQNIWKNLALEYGVPEDEVSLIDFNRTGVYLPNNEVKVNYRVRFMASFLGEEADQTWFALPVRQEGDSYFSAKNGYLYFNDQPMATTGQLILDTCNTHYQRGPKLLNLNSRSRGNCGGCKACVHNYKDLYDQTVLMDQHKLVSKDEIKDFFDEKEADGLDIAELKQIAVVTGLFGTEAAVVEHMRLISEVVGEKGFTGELMYFGCEVNSEQALTELSQLGEFSLIYAIDNFTKRKDILNRGKSSITIDTARKTLISAKEKGMRTSFAYISGIDSLSEMETGFEKLKDSVTSFPIINIYQIQTPGQLMIMDDEARKLDYYIKSRKTIEGIFEGTGLQPRRWENYRPLWYKNFGGKLLWQNAFGN